MPKITVTIDTDTQCVMDKRVLKWLLEGRDMEKKHAELWAAIKAAPDYPADTHICDASGAVCVRKNENYQTQDDLCTADDTLPLINEATGHDTELEDE
jgi:hypothetical protein